MAKQKGAVNSLMARSRRSTFVLFSLPGLILYSLFFIYPVGLGIVYSMTDWNGISRNWNFIGFKNYQTMMTTKRFKTAMAFTTKYTALLLVIIVVLSIVLALLLNRKIKGITFYRGMFFLPAVLCGITISLVFSQIFMRVLPAVGKAIGSQFFSLNILGKKDTAMYGVLFVHVWQGVAMPTVLMLAGLQTVPEELYESAMLDGANAWHRFWKITMPFLLPTLTIVSILTLKSGLGVFDYIRGLTDGGPSNATISISYLIWDDAFARKRFSLAIAEAIVISLILFAFSIFQTWLTNKRKVDA